ncbi:MAG: hypothetical protein FWG70_00760 [Oscillospiraceae bacterium]|nr:hypothetical protein [Oscillospiraceae bacterium]
MKIQFKYAFLTALHTRGFVFAAVSLVMITFIVLGSMGLLPMAAHITAVSLGGVGIAVMLMVNMISDISITNRLYSSQKAYLYALTPMPRWKYLLASCVARVILDVVTTAVVIIGEVWLSLNLAGVAAWDEFWRAIRYANVLDVMYVVLFALLILSGFIFLTVLDFFWYATRGSIFFKKPLSWLWAFLLCLGCLYVVSLSWLILAPLATISRWGIFFTVTLNGAAGIAACTLLILGAAAALFILTAKLTERRLNI